MLNYYLQIVLFLLTLKVIIPHKKIALEEPMHVKINIFFFLNLFPSNKL